MKTQYRSKKQGAKPKKPSSSQYVGVHRNQVGKYVASLYISPVKSGLHRREYIGIYDSEIEAAEAYNAKAMELFGCDARLNNIAKGAKP